MSVRELVAEFARAAERVDTAVRVVAEDSMTYPWLAALSNAMWTDLACKRHASIFRRAATIGGARTPSCMDISTEYSWGVTSAELGVAETGSVLLDEPDLESRLVSMSAERLVVLLPQSRLHSDLYAVSDWLNARAGCGTYATLLSGPSRTADIERSLTIGVQGPCELHVVITA